MIPKKVRYVPGLISLIGLAILLILFGPEDRVQQTVIKLNLPTDDIKQSDSIFTKGNVLQSIKNTKLTTIYLWDKQDYYNDPNRETFFNNEKLLLIQDKLKEMSFTRDSTMALKVELSEDDTYGEFVWLLNQTIIYDVKRYGYFDDAFYFIANDPPIDPAKFPVDPIYLEPGNFYNATLYPTNQMGDFYVENRVQIRRDWLYA
ncbi:hypothetical protein BH10BAC2_BH10BAC2_44320 [soil metagenome]